MPIFDVSVPIRAGMVHYPGDPGVSLELARSRAAGDDADVSRLDLGVHTGTHVDAPVHFLDGGAGAEELPLEAMLGPAHVADATSVEGRAVGAAALSRLTVPEDCRRLLLKTRNSELWGRDGFTDDFVSLDGSGARWLVDRAIVLVGIDYLSIGDAEAHRVLLGSGVVPVEGLDLRGVEPGPYELACLPLRIPGVDGAPARVVLVR